MILFAAVVLLVGFALTFAAKLPALDSRNTVNVNTDPSDKIASALRVPAGIGKLIVNYRDAHGSFANTASLSEVPLLTEHQARILLDIHTKEDITRLSPGQLAARLKADNSVGERLVEIFAARGDRLRLTEAGLTKLSAVSGEQITRMDSRLRVRGRESVVLRYWVYFGLMLAGFFLFHLIYRRANPHADPFLLPCVMMLAGIGAIMLFSLKDPLRDTDVFTSQVHGVWLGIAAALIPLTAKFRSIRPWRYTYLYAILAILLTILLALFGTGPGGARLKLFGFQPVEIVKLALVFYVASYLADRASVLMDQTGPRRRLQLPLFRDIGPLAVMYLLSLTTFLLVRDLGPMLLLFGMFVMMLFVATGRPSFVGVGVVLIGLTGWLAHVLRLGVFDVRVDMWLSPWKNAHANGMQLAQSLWGFGTGGIWGSGPGLGQPGFMARAGSDLIFATIGEELGLIGALAVLILCCLFIARAFKAAMHACTDFDRFLGAGVTQLFGIQVIIIVFGVLGLLPLTGVTLPFVSFGKSSMIASFFVLGLLLSMSGRSQSQDMRVESRRAVRALATGMILLLIGVAGIGRLMWIQGVKADQIAGRTVTTPDADGITRPKINPRLRAIEASIPRGTIYDRNGRPLATSRKSELEELGLAETAVGRPRGRVYPYDSAFSHLVGYVDSRCGGPVGFERWRNSDLRGFSDYSELLPVYRLRNTPYTPRIKGRDIRLTIDAELQSVVEKALLKHAGSVRDRRTGQRKHKGAAVVLDVYTGEVLAAVSTPNFDPNVLTLGRWKAYNEDRGGEAALFDRAMNGVYPPGSTFKLLTAAAALENGLEFTYNCKHQATDVVWRSDGKTYSRRRITDLEEMRPHGLTNLSKAVRSSCNVYFAHLGTELGAEKLYDMGHKFGFSRMPPPNKLVEDLPDNAYGQGTIQVSPLEMARMVAAIANGGVMMKPILVKDVRSGSEIVEAVEPEESARPISPETAAALRRMMAEVTTTGTGRGVFNGLGVSVGGKTGSAENDQADRMPHSWFVGFAPADDPRIAFAVVVENAGYGRSVAGPVCREIVREAL